MLTTRRLTLLMALISASAVSACAANGPHEWVAKHASVQLECPQEEVVVTPNVEPMYHQVSGCGKTDFMVELNTVKTCGIARASISRATKRSSRPSALTKTR